MSVVQPPPSLFDVSCVMHVHSTLLRRDCDGRRVARRRSHGRRRRAAADRSRLPPGAPRRLGGHARRRVAARRHRDQPQAKGTISRSASRTKFPTRAGRRWRSPRPCGRQVGSVSPPTRSPPGGTCSYRPLARRIVPPHGWPALDDPRGYDGLELWSLTTDAAEGWRTPAEALRWLRDPQPEVAKGPPAHHLRRWDELSARRRVPDDRRARRPSARHPPPRDGALSPVTCPDLRPAAHPPAMRPPADRRAFNRPSDHAAGSGGGPSLVDLPLRGFGARVASMGGARRWPDDSAWRRGTRRTRAAARLAAHGRPRSP